MLCVMRGRVRAGTIFSWCNLRCVYSQNWEFRSKGKGQEVTSLKLVRVMLEVQERGCHNVNLVSSTCVIVCIGCCCYGEAK
jgi:putative pyruvate formate lyase activating enzyme